MGRCISHIIPTLNEARTLDETLDSIENQAGDKEVIIAGSFRLAFKPSSKLLQF